MSEAPTRLSAGPLADALRKIQAPDFDGSSAPPPGGLVALSRGGGVSYAATGFAQRDTGTAMEWATRTDAGSVTKIMATTMAAMALFDAGIFDLDAPVGRYLQVADSHPVATATLRDLLEHQAGLWEWWPLYLSGARGDEALSLAASLPLRYPPHSGRHYSDLGFILLGAIVAQLAGGDLATSVRRLVLTRFGLDSTSFAAPVPGGSAAASSAGDTIEREMIRSGVPYPVRGSVDDFDRWRHHRLVGEVSDGNAFHAFDGVSGHAGLFTTAADLLRLANGLLRSLDGDGPLRRSTVLHFLAPGRDPAQALGLRVWRSAAGPAYGHTGFPGLAFALLPAQNATLVMITNRLHAPGPPRSTEDMWRSVLTAAELELARQ